MIVIVPPHANLFTLWSHAFTRPNNLPGKTKTKKSRIKDYQLILAFACRMLAVPLNTLDLFDPGRCQADRPGTILSAAVAMGKDRSVAIAGSVTQESNDFSAIKLDVDGRLLWEWQVTNKLLLASSSIV